jgi:hypothetical protein
MAGGGLGLVVLSACGGSSKKFDLGKRFSDDSLVPGDVRMPVSLVVDGQLADDGPSRLSGRIADAEGTTIVDKVTAEKHGKGLPGAYWPFIAPIASPGIYTLFVDGATKDGMAFQVNDPSAVQMPLVGQPLPPFDTPTNTDHRGVDPVCTREPPCPLHDVTLTDALQQGKPVAYLVATPAFCQFGVCAPILDLLLGVRDDVGPEVTFVHSEVYTDDTAKTVAPAVEAYHLSYEPVLFVTDAKGTIVERLDVMMDADEIRAAIDKAGV